MDARTQRRVLWLVGVMLGGYAASAACFALAYVTRQRWLLIVALVAAATAIATSTLLRPVVVGFDRWWRDAPAWRRASNVLLLLVRVAVVGVVAWGAFTFGLR